MSKRVFCGICTWNEQLNQDVNILDSKAFQKYRLQERMIQRKKSIGLWCKKCKLFTWQIISGGEIKKLNGEIINSGEFVYGKDIFSNFYSDYDLIQEVNTRVIDHKFPDSKIIVFTSPKPWRKNKR